MQLNGDSIDVHNSSQLNDMDKHALELELEVNSPLQCSRPALRQIYIDLKHTKHWHSLKLKHISMQVDYDENDQEAHNNNNSNITTANNNNTLNRSIRIEYLEGRALCNSTVECIIIIHASEYTSARYIHSLFSVLDIQHFTFAIIDSDSTVSYYKLHRGLVAS